MSCVHASFGQVRYRPVASGSRCCISRATASEESSANEVLNNKSVSLLASDSLVKCLQATGPDQLLLWDVLTLPGIQVNYQSELWSSSDKVRDVSTFMMRTIRAAGFVVILLLFRLVHRQHRNGHACKLSRIVQKLLEKTIRSWRSRTEQLCPFYSDNVQSTSQLEPGSFDVVWRATWVPRQLVWLDSLGKAWPGVTVKYYDVLDRYDQQSQFRWRALFNLFAGAFRTGVLKLPASAIESKWTIKLDNDGKRLSVNDRTWLIPMFQQLKVKNRRIARDMLQWQEVRQPADMNYTMWDSKVMQSLQIDEVPGMGQFDIDGVDADDRNNLYGDVLVIMCFAVVIILSFGLSYAWVLSQNYSAAYDLDPDLVQLISNM